MTSVNGATASSPGARQSAPPAQAPTAGFVEGKSVEIVAERKEMTKVFANPDGTRTMRLSTQPVHFKGVGGSWQDIDTSIVADENHPGGLRNRANAWTVRFAALPEGVTVETGEGPFNLSPLGTWAVQPTIESADTVIYRDAWPGTDLRYRVYAGEIKEDIVLRRRPDRTSFAFSTGSRRYDRQADKSGGLVPAGARSLKVAPPEVLDRDGRPVPEARPTLTPGDTDKGVGIHVGVDPEWANNLRAEQFPISIDPTFLVGSNLVSAYKSDGYSCGCGVRTGNSRDVQPSGQPADRYWRSVAYFDYSAIYGKRVRSAAVSVSNRVAGTANAYPFHAFAATAWNFTGAGTLLGTTNAGENGTISSAQLTSTYDTWAQQSQAGALMFAGHEVGGLYTYKQFHGYLLSLTYDNGDPIGFYETISAPAPSQLRVTGWAIDPDTTASITVAAFIDTNPNPIFIPANGSRPDVGAVYPGFGNNHGFDGTFAAAPGPHNVCVYALNGAAPGSNSSLGCKSVTVTAPPPTTVPPSTTTSTSSTTTTTAPPGTTTTVPPTTTTTGPTSTTTTTAPSSTTTTAPPSTTTTTSPPSSTTTTTEPPPTTTTSTVPVLPPGAVTGLFGTAGQRTATLSWTPPEGDITGYIVSVEPACPDCDNLDPSGNSTIVTGLQPATSYAFNVRARNAGGTGPPADDDLELTTDPAPPDAPNPPSVDSTGVTDGSGSASLSWNQPALNGSILDGYEVEVDPDCPCRNRIIDDPGQLSTNVIGMTIGSTYKFRVRAVADTGGGVWSDWSDEAMIRRDIGSVSFMTWNLKQGDLASPAEFANRIVQADVVGLQEVTDSDAQAIADELGWNLLFEPTKDPCIPGPGECDPFGNALLSHFPLPPSQKRVWTLTPAAAETGPGNVQDRKLLRGVVEIDGISVYAYVTHLAAAATDAERELQAAEVVTYMLDESSSHNGVTVLLGDINDDLGSGTIEALRTRFNDSCELVVVRYPDDCPYTNNAAGGMPTRRIDYVFFGKESGFVPQDYSTDSTQPPPDDEGNPRYFSDHYAVIAQL